MPKRFSLSVVVVLLLIGLSTSLAVQSVKAEDATPSPQSADVTTSPTPIPTPAQDIQQDINTLQNTYHGQLEEYRTAEKQYQIATTQYKQLNTLVSLEAALQATKQAMLSRDQVLLTYVTLMQRTLTVTPGINLDQKTAATQALASQSISLQKHLNDTQQAQSREEIAQLTPEFAPIGQTTQGAVYKAQTLIAVGKLQTIYDKAVTLSDDINQNLVMTTSDIKQGQRQRAIDEIKTSLALSKQDIDQTLQRRVVNNDLPSRSSFENSLENLNQVYVDLSQSLNFLDQLMRI